MKIAYYDQTFEGLLCVIFDAYKLKYFPEHILATGDVPPLLTTFEHTVETANGKYERVLTALKKKLSKSALNNLTKVWLSEVPEREMLLFRYICKVFDHQQNIESNFADEDVMAVLKLAKKVGCDMHFISMMVRFNKTADDVFFAPVAPTYNVLPLVLPHFKDRFSDQKWAIYDEKRGYGFYYDLEKIVEMTLSEADDFLVHHRLNEKYQDEDDKLITLMWQRYFKALTIKERINLKQQRRAMPARFWAYLPEMQDRVN